MKHLKSVLISTLLLSSVAVGGNTAISYAAGTDQPIYTTLDDFGDSNPFAGSGTFGVRFQVTNQKGFVVKALGVFDLNNDGFFTAAGGAVTSRMVGLWSEETQALLASLEIVNGDANDPITPVAGGWDFTVPSGITADLVETRFVFKNLLTPLTLETGQTYRVGVFNATGGTNDRATDTLPLWYDIDNPAGGNDSIFENSFAYLSSSSTELSYPNVSDDSNGFVPSANVYGEEIPEPRTIAALILLGLGGVWQKLKSNKP